MMQRTKEGQCMAPPVQKIPVDAFGPAKDTRLFWLGQAGFMLNARGIILLLDPLLITRAGDPVLSETGSEMFAPWPIEAEQIPRTDAVLYTHTDDDHLGPETAKILMKLDPVFIGTPYCRDRLQELGASPVRCLSGVPLCTSKRGKNGNTFDIGEVVIEILPADHPWQLLDPDAYGRVFGPEDCCGFRVTTMDGVFVFPGDTRLMKHHIEMQGVAVLALDVSQDPYHLGLQGAAVLTKHLKDSLLIPYHYGTFRSDSPAHSGDPEEVLGGIEDGLRRGRILAPGQPLILREGKEISAP
ncbi:MAG: MBL fold metallo-hydrolase [Treponema sp.]|jgi:L-ascorbate metabolism protein UlaG (beta-lactamase superfamily)|nr:MBL fold metallo-hydrolase [Treponema sp.]